MIPPDLAVHAGSAIPELVGTVVATATFGVTMPFFQPRMPILQLATSLLIGLVITVIAWLALLFVVVHGRYVTDAVAAGRYRKGPFHDRSPRSGSKLVDLDAQDGREERERDEDE